MRILHFLKVKLELKVDDHLKFAAEIRIKFYILIEQSVIGLFSKDRTQKEHTPFQIFQIR